MGRDNEVKPGTRCQCRHGNRCHDDQPAMVGNLCPRDAVRLVTVRVFPEARYTGEQEYFDVPLCQACAEYHEKGGKS